MFPWSPGSSKPSIEVGIIGREGMTGLAVLLGGDRAAHDSYVQVAGKGQRISAANLRGADERSPPCIAPCCGSQTIHSPDHHDRTRKRPKQDRGTLGALAFDGGRSRRRQRRTSHARVSRVMLGTYRPGVTKRVQALEKEDLIAARRGGITILDRKGLEKRSNGTCAFRRW